MTSRWRSRRGVGSLVAGLFIILILLAFITSLIVISRSQGKYSEIILENIEKKVREMETHLDIKNIEVLSGNRLNITVSNLGSLDVHIRYVGIFNVNTRIGHYYNASEIGTGVKGVLINRFSEATNITTYETIIEDLSTGRWIIQLLTVDGVVASSEYPTTTTTTTANLTTWNSLTSPANVFPSGSTGTYGHLPKLEYYNASSIITLKGTHLSGDIDSIKATDSDYYVVYESTTNTTLYLWPTQLEIGGDKYFEIRTSTTPYDDTIRFEVDRVKDDNTGDNQYNWKRLKSNRIAGRKYNAEFVYLLNGRVLNAGIYYFYYNVYLENKDNKVMPKETLAFAVSIYIMDNGGNIVRTIATYTALAHIPVDLNKKGQQGDKYNGTIVGQFKLSTPYYSNVGEYLLVEYWVGLNRTDNNQSNNVKARMYPYIDSSNTNYNFSDFMRIIAPGAAQVGVLVSFSNTYTYNYVILKMNYTSVNSGLAISNLSLLNWTSSTYDTINSNISSSPASEFTWIVALPSDSDYYSGTSLKIRLDTVFYGSGDFKLYINLIQTLNKSFQGHGIYFLRTGYMNISYYNLDNNTWINIANAPFLWPNNSRIVYLNSTYDLLVSNTTHLLKYDTVSKTWSVEVSLSSLGISSGDGSALYYLNKYANLVIYVVGGGSNQIWLYNLTSHSFYPSPITLPGGVKKFSVGDTDGWEVIYLTLGYHSDIFIKINITAYLNGETYLTYLDNLPSTYLVGMAKYGNYIYAVDRGGAIYRYDIAGDSWSMVGPNLPFNIYGDGDRLYAYNNKLYFVRADSTRDIIYIDINDLYLV